MNLAHKQSFIFFHVGQQGYALPLADVEEILPMVELSRPADAPRALMGVMDLGGKPVSVISVRGLFQLPDRPAQLYTPLILLKTETPALALCVDDVSEMVHVAPEQILPVGEGCSVNNCVTGVIKLPSHRALILATDRLLLEQERARLRDLETLASNRLQETCEAPA